MNEFLNWNLRSSNSEVNIREPQSPDVRSVDLHMKEFANLLKSKKEKVVKDALTQMIQYLNFIGEATVSTNLAAFLEETIHVLASCLERFETPDTTLKVLSCIYLIARNVPSVFKKPFMITRKNETEEQHLVSFLCSKFGNTTHLDILEKILNIFDIVASKNPEKIIENNVIFLVLEKFDFMDHANQTFMIHILYSCFNIFSNLEIFERNLAPKIPDLLAILMSKPSIPRGELRKLWLCLAKRVVTLASYKNKNSIQSICRDEILEMILDLLRDSIKQLREPDKFKTAKACFQTLSSLFTHSDQLTLSAFKNYHLIEFLHQIITTCLDKQASAVDEEIYIPIIKEGVIFLNSILAIRGTPLPLMQQLFQIVMDINLAENTLVEHKLFLFKDNKVHLTKILELFMNLLIDLFMAFPGIVFKYLILFCIEKLITFSDYQELEKLLDFRKVSTLLHTLLASNDVIMLSFGLHLIDTLVCKVMPVYGILLREGIMMQLEKIGNKTKKTRWSIFGVPVEVVLRDQYMMQSEHPQPEKVYDVSYDEDKFLEFLVDHRRYFIESDHLYFEDLQSSNIKHKVNSCDLSAISFLTHDNPFQTQSTQTMKDRPKNFDTCKKAMTIPDFESSPINRDAEHNFAREFRSEKIVKVADVYERIVVKRIDQISFEINRFSMAIVGRFYKYSNYCKTGIDIYVKPLANLIKLSESFGTAHTDEMGMNLFASFFDLLKTCENFTIHEYRNSHFFNNLIDFLFAKTIDNSSLRVKPKVYIEEEQTRNPNKGIYEDTNTPATYKLNKEQQDTIAGRLFLFYHFLEQKCPISSYNTMEDYFSSTLINSLPIQENSLTYHDSYEDRRYSEINSEVEKLLETVYLNMSFLDKSLREDDKKDLSRNLLSRLIQSEEVTVVNPLKIEDLNDCFEYKKTIYRDIKVIRLSVEKIQTLECVENYLLNRLYTPEDKNFGEDFNIFSFNFPEYLNERINEARGRRRMADYSDGEIPNELPEQVGMMKMHYYSRPRNLLENRQKMPNPNPLESPKITRYGSLSYPSMMSVPRRKSINAHSEKPFDFTQFFEIKFFLDDKELDKKQSLFQIIHNAKLTKIQKGYAPRSCWHDNIDLTFQLQAKKPCLLRSGCYVPKDMVVMLQSFNFTADKIISSLIDKVEETRYSSEAIKVDYVWVTMLLKLIGEIRGNMKPHFTHASSPFNPILMRNRKLFPAELLEKMSKTKADEFTHLNTERTQLAVHQQPNKLLGINIWHHLTDTLVIVAECLPKFSEFLIYKFPTLVPIEVRKRCFKIYKMPLLRRLYFFHQLSKQRKREHDALRIFTITKKKSKVERRRLLENAVNHFETIGGLPNTFEFQFTDEEGIGNGPTQEYYSIICDEFRNAEHNIWRKTSDNTLFPSPIDPLDLKILRHNSNKRRPKPENERDFEKLHLIFRMMGTFAATGILEEKTLDLPFHPVFWKVILDMPVYMSDIASIDKELGTTLMEFQSIVNKKNYIENDASLSITDKKKAIEELSFKGCRIEDLALNFTFPGYDEIDLKEGGIDIPVTIYNLEEYISLLSHFYLIETIKTQVYYFREGFEKVFPLSSLRIFLPEEIECLYCEQHDDHHWTLEKLTESVLPSYGYSTESPTFKNLLRVMSEFKPTERRLFLKFVTGSSRLPHGGFKMLNPKMNVAKRVSGSNDIRVDNMFPSVMTCQNFLKLPDYSSAEILKTKLAIAIEECQNNFSLT